jgi:hypothetical protein
MRDERDIHPPALPAFLYSLFPCWRVVTFFFRKKKVTKEKAPAVPDVWNAKPRLRGCLNRAFARL